MPDTPATEVYYQGQWAGSAPVYISDLHSQEIHGRKFGLLGNMTDETAKLNALFAAAHGEGKTAHLGKGAYGATNTILSRTPNIKGDGTLQTILYPMAGFPQGADVLRIEPNPGDVFEYPETEGFLVTLG